MFGLKIYKNVFSTYALQMECEEWQKEEFGSETKERMRKIPRPKDILIGVDMNEFVISDRTGYGGVLRGYEFDVKN